MSRDQHMLRTVLIAPVTFRRLCRARDLLVRTEKSVGAVAREVGFSPFEMIRKFAAVFGETPHQLRRNRRLDEARRLLENGASVTDACMRVGYSSVGSFSTLFRERVGTSPSLWVRPKNQHDCYSMLGAISEKQWRRRSAKLLPC